MVKRTTQTCYLFCSLPRSRFLDVTQRPQKGALRDIQKTVARETTCFAALLQNELNSDIDLFTTHESKLF